MVIKSIDDTKEEEKEIVQQIKQKVNIEKIDEVLEGQIYEEEEEIKKEVK